MSDAPHPGWLAALWPGLGERQAAALLAAPRLRARLLERLAQRFGWAPGASDGSPDALLAAGPLAGIDAAAALAGAVWHARSIRQVIASREVEALTAAIGAAERTFALARIDLAVAPAERLDLPVLLRRIDAAAALCRAAWLAALPPGLRGLVVPRLPPGPEGVRDLGADAEPACRLMACVAAHLASGRG